MIPVLATSAVVSPFITEVGAIFTAVVGWLTSVGSTIMADPILLTMCAIPLCGLAIGIFKRLLNVQ